MVEPVDPTTRTSMSNPWARTPGSLPYAAAQSAARPASAPRDSADAPAATDPEPPAPPSSLEVEIVRRDAQAGEMGINVVRVLNPRTGEPIYQSPPEGVLVMLESALWRLRKKDTDD